MRLSCCAAALLLAFFPAVAVAQASTPHAGHAPAPATRAVAPRTAVLPGLADDPSIFSTYRRFNPEEPLVDWRAANEAVGNAGGHVGIMRASKKTNASPAAPEAARKPETPKGHH